MLESSNISFIVGIPGFEPGTPCSQSRCANRTALHPAIIFKCKGTTYFEICNTFPKKYFCFCWNHSKKTARRSPKEQALVVLLWGFAECGNRKALRLKAQGVYSCKWLSLNVDNNAASAAQCNRLRKRGQRRTYVQSSTLLQFMKTLKLPSSRCP